MCRRGRAHAVTTRIAELWLMFAEARVRNVTLAAVADVTCCRSNSRALYKRKLIIGSRDCGRVHYGIEEVAGIVVGGGPHGSLKAWYFVVYCRRGLLRV